MNYLVVLAVLVAGAAIAAIALILWAALVKAGNANEVQEGDK